MADHGVTPDGSIYRRLPKRFVDTNGPAYQCSRCSFTGSALVEERPSGARSIWCMSCGTRLLARDCMEADA